VSRTRRLAVVLLLNLGLVTALVVVGLAAHSLAVFAAGADYLADAAAIGVSLLAIWLAARPRGYPNATTVAALVNAGWLLILNIGIAVAAVWHLAAGTHRVEGLPVLIVSAIAALVMAAGALVLGGDAGDDDGTEDLNVKAVLLDTAADAAAAAGVAVSGAVILGAGGWYWLDPATALVIAVIVGYHALKLIRTITPALRSPLPGLAPGSNPARHRHEDRQAGGRTDILRLTGDAFPARASARAVLRVDCTRVAGNPGRRRSRSYGCWHFAARMAGSGSGEGVGVAHGMCIGGCRTANSSLSGRKNF
jgi:cobalt-zinc-cadmium efflux system protein